MVQYHCIAAVLLVLSAGAAAARPSAAQEPGPVGRFVVLLQGRQLGTEETAVTATPDGWTIRGSGRLGNPIDLSTSRFEARYDRQWRPLALEIDATLRGLPLIVRTTFAGGNATNDFTQAGQQSHKVDAVSADPLVLPNMYFCAYEALALRLQNIAVPAELRAYVAPQAEIPISVTASTNERIRTADRVVAARRFDLTIVNPGSSVRAEIWTDEAGRLLRFSAPDQGLDVAREDVAAVSARVEKMGRANDEQLHMPANGFSLEGTLSKPASAPVAPGPRKALAYKLPAVILVPGSARADRDETVAGIPMFAQIANFLADAGFAVIRYDKRGVGQSGGREEAVTIGDYAQDVGSVISYLSKRRDVDPHRIVVVGHGEGGLIGMLAAAEAKSKISALALLATPGTSGADLVIEQQQHLLDLMNLPDGERQTRIELQERIHHAVITGQGWEGIPAGYRNQADTPWFRSLLMFDPAKMMARVPHPVLVIQGELDRQVPTRHGQLLLDAAKARKKSPGADLVTIEGINHLLVPAQTGETDEYATLQDKRISPKVLDALATWLKDKLNVDAAGAGR